MTADRVYAPWTGEQVISINYYQSYTAFIPKRCPTQHYSRFPALVATPDGYICPLCDFKQNWCGSFEANGYIAWIKDHESIMRAMKKKDAPCR